MVEAARIFASHSLHVIKGNQKGLSEGFGKTLICILLYEKTRCTGDGESNVSLNPKCFVLAIPF